MDTRAGLQKGLTPLQWTLAPLLYAFFHIHAAGGTGPSASNASCMPGGGASCILPHRPQCKSQERAGFLHEVKFGIS